MSRLAFTILVSLAFGATLARAGDIFAEVPPTVARFAMDANTSLLAQEHLWVPGGALSVNPDLEGVGSFRNVIAPPWATTEFACRFAIDGAAVKSGRHRWMPGEFQSEGVLPSGVRVSSVLSPIVVERGLVEAIRLQNPTLQPVRLAIALTLSGEFAKVPKHKWTYGAVTRKPPAGSPNPVAWTALKLQRDDAPAAGLIVRSEQGVLRVASDLPGEAADSNGWAGELVLAPGEARTFSLALAMGESDAAAALVRAGRADPAGSITTNRRRWEERIAELYRRVPRLSSSSRELVDFYDRSLLSYLVARWDGADFATQPYYPTSGLDGGALCLYAWDYSYTAMLNPLVHPESDRAVIKLLLNAGLFHNYSVLPFDGAPSGPWYAYNHYAITQLIYYYVLHTGDRAFLSERVNGRTVLEWARDHAVYLDRLDAPAGLIDYGTNENLLELHRTDAYLHFVPSPNAERCWSYRAVDEMAGWAGVKPFGLARRADELAAVVHQKLWDPAARWFAALDASGHPRLCYSIQIFDLLRQGILTPAERDGVLTHLNDKEFLSPWGVHSLARTDPGYDETDVDWGGPGVYTGDAPQLVQDLLGSGCEAAADDLLQRILWWGQRLPYYPQAIRADRGDYRHDGRANVIAGAMGAQAVIFGLLGCAVKPDGAIELNPHLPAFATDLAFSGLKLRGRTLDVTLDRNGYRVVVDGQPSPTRAFGRRCVIPPARPTNN